jgi:hypothetical protein
MGIKRHSIQTLAAKGFIPSEIYAAQNPNRIVNPLWNFTLPHTFQGTVAGYATAGIPQIGIDKFPFASDANATDVGNLSVSRRSTNAGQSSDVSGYTSAGFGPTWSNVIDKFPFATNANATDVGDVTFGRYSATGQSSDVSGYTSGGRTDSGVVPYGTSRDNIIDKFPFATNANATDVGDLTFARSDGASQSSTLSGYTSGGYSTPSITRNVIDKFPFASNANATDVGDLVSASYSLVGQQD